MSIESLVIRIRTAVDRTQIVSILTDCCTFAQSEVSDSNLSTAGYCILLHTIIDRFQPQFIGNLTKREFDTLICPIFFLGPAIDSFVVSIDCLAGDLYRTDKLLHILDLLERQRLVPLFRRLSVVETGMDTDPQLLDSLIQSLASLSDKVANVLKGISSDKFRPERHISLLVKAICSALQLAYDRLRNNQDADLRFVASILAKLCLVGHGHQVIRSLVRWLATRGPSTPLWDRISQRIFTTESDRRLLEILLTKVIISCNLGHLPRIIGNSLLDDDRIRYLLTHKLLLVRIFNPKDEMPVKIVECLWGNKRKTEILNDTLLHLLDVWADSSALNRSSINQRQYLCRSVLIFGKKIHSDRLLAESIRIQVEERMLIGLQAHLHCVDIQRRQQGLFVAECLAAWFKHPDSDEQKNHLTFEYQDDEYVNELKALMNEESGSDGKSQLDDDDLNLLENITVESDVSLLKSTAILGDVDSDDEDFIPYHLPPEEMNCSSKKPTKFLIYIRDCFDQLNEEKDYSKFETALLSVEPLIRRKAVGFEDIAIPMCERLLFLEDRFSIENFMTIRACALSAYCVVLPSKVAVFLCEQFYAKNYTISQRLLILDTISSAAVQLSTSESTSTDAIDNTLAPVLIPSEFLPIWRQVIDDRIARNSRHFRSRPLKSQKPPTMNRFAPVCNLFFAPLINSFGAKIDSHLDLVGRDYLLLGRLLYTLGSVLDCSFNSPSVPSMADMLSQLVWPLRFHEQRFVRQATIYCYCTIGTTVPRSILATGSADIVREWVNWLSAIVRNDPCSECQQLATKTGALLVSRLEDGFRGFIQL